MENIIDRAASLLSLYVILFQAAFGKGAVHAVLSMRLNRILPLPRKSSILLGRVSIMLDEADTEAILEEDMNSSCRVGALRTGLHGVVFYSGWCISISASSCTSLSWLGSA